MFLTTLPNVITPTVSYLFFQFSAIKRMIFETLSNLLEFPFDLCSSKPIYRQMFDPLMNFIG